MKERRKGRRYRSIKQRKCLSFEAFLYSVLYSDFSSRQGRERDTPATRTQRLIQPTLRCYRRVRKAEGSEESRGRRETEQRWYTSSGRDEDNGGSIFLLFKC